MGFLLVVIVVVLMLGSVGGGGPVQGRHSRLDGPSYLLEICAADTRHHV